MEEERDSKGVGEEKQDQEVAGEQDKAKKMEEELEKAKITQEKEEGKKEMEGDNAKTTEEELVKKAKRMQEKHKGKKEMEEDTANKMEEELEKKEKRMQEKHEGKKEMEEEEEWDWDGGKEEVEEEEEWDWDGGKEEVEEEEEWEWEWDGEGQEVGLIKKQEADSNIRKKSFVSKLVSKISRKEKPKVDDDPLTERLIKQEMRRELRWQARRILGNGRYAPRAFDQVVEAMHDLKITNIKDLEPQHYLLEYPSWKTIPDPFVPLAELKNEFRTHVTRILSDEGGTDLKAYEHASSLLPSIKSFQRRKSLQEEYGCLQDSMPSLCGICQSPITEEDPFADEKALAVLDEYAQDFHRPCLNSWLQEPQPTYLPRVEYDPMCRNIIIFKLLDSWTNPLEIYETRKPETIRDEIFNFSEEKKEARFNKLIKKISSTEARFNKLIKKISSTNIDKRDKGIAEINNIRQDTEMMTQFIGFLCHNPEFIPALLHFTVTTAASLNVEVQDDILTVVLYACNHKTNKKPIGKDPFTIPYLIIALESELTVRIKVKCAAALISLSDLYYNKIKIGDLGGIRQLAKLLEESHKEAKKAAALAILSLCMAQENHQKALEANMVDMAVRLIGQKIVMEESLMTLWMLRNSRPAMTALAGHEMVEQYLPIVLRNPSNTIQPESIEVTCHAWEGMVELHHVEVAT